MKLLLLLTLVAAGSASLPQFNEMTMCTVGLSFSDAMSDYMGYGCHCGFGGKGDPRDATDKCCGYHDACYREAMNNGCSMSDRYLITYDYQETKAADGTCSVTCSTEDQYPASDKKAQCKAFMCGCDSTGSNCFATNRDTFSQKYKNFPQLFCF
ncbi:phospholipase A2 AP-PLA2-I-like isoform X1 [Asterias rubens]|uniref:phospholipase A2 AP-PLA2-I-like isoform X1 n=2 Tax=Asterias rubens TaxID=7604 RepID=UPI001455A3F0|nr:phospholipase A2 AP-PLA2-I-like isoform X1 [Asterias rubens]